MNRRWSVAAVVLALIVGALAGVWFERRQTPAETGIAVATSSPIEPPALPGEPRERAVTVPAESLDRMRLRYAEVTEETITQDLRVPGTVQPNAYREVRVTPLVGGIAIQIPVQIGQTVKRGETMARLFSQELAAAQASLLALSADLELEHKKLLRAQELVRLGAASREELETVETSHKVHTTHVEEARQKLLLLGLTEEQIAQVAAGRQVSSEIAVPAPIDGVVLTRSVNLGQVVTTAQELFTVTDLSSVWIEGNLLENDFASVRVGSPASIATPAYPGRTYRGRVEYIDPRVDPQTRTAKVRVVVENAGLALRLGMYMDVLFRTGGARVPVVPRAAVQAIGPTSVVYLPVEGEEGRFLEREVKLGPETAAGFRVLEGLKPRQRVVTEGSFLLRAESLRQHPR
jgi:RND family efflux transporter MFP subunit